MEEDIKGNNQKDDKILYQCKECGFHYADKNIAEKCEKWCEEHKTCNVEITKNAEENLVSNYIELDTKEKNEEGGGVNLVGQVGELKSKRDEYLNNWKRSAADFLNYKKDETERLAAFAGYAKEDMILKFLPILDNFYLAEKGLPEKLKSGEEGTKEAQEWTKGFLQIQKQIDDFLKKEGIEEIKTEGEKFNPETMEVAEEVEIEDKEQGIVVEELQKGYMMNGRLLRPAKVKITK